MVEAYNKTTLYIDSNNRHSSDSINDFTMQLNGKYKDIRAIEVRDVNMTNSFYNVDTTNNLLYFTDSGSTSRTATLNPCYYDDTNIILELDRAMNATATSDKYSSTWNDIAGKVTIAVDDGTFILELSNTTTAVWDVLGYDTGTNTSASASHEADDVMTLNCHNYVDIRSPEISSSLDSNLESQNGVLQYSDILARLNVDNVTLRDHVGWTQEPDRTIIRFSNNLSLSKLNFYTTDRKGNPAQHNGNDYNMTIILHHQQTSRIQEFKQPRIPLKKFKRRKKDFF